ncbi:MAG: YqeG family HAD IIIA-type phosphatase [Candidatus Eremiobacteraeota bacterium]|nr:YqeG family HAD IIIA-type phosphatase [Candidatus Eremiobacteraeota bacterium]
MPWMPDRYAPRISEIPVADLYAEGVRGVIVDLDNTLVGYRHEAPAPEVAAWVESATAQGLRLVVVSNNVRAWVEEVATNLKISFVHKAAKPLPVGFGKALQLLKTTRKETIVIGDQFFTDVIGAKLYGLRVILTEPIVPREHRVMRFVRRLERMIIRNRAKRF